MNGVIYVFTGPMFSSKTTELLEQYRDYRKTWKCQLFSSSLDTRYGNGKVITHDGDSEEAFQVSDVSEIEKNLDSSTRCIFIDEIHLIKGEMADFCKRMADDGRIVFVSGLDLDYKGEPFPEMVNIMADADVIVKKHGKCAVCGLPSRYSYRKAPEGGKLLVGGNDIYEPRCRNCFEVGRDGTGER
jgi:thymidine kinase